MFLRFILIGLHFSNHMAYLLCTKRFDPSFMHRSVVFPMMKKENKYAEKFFQKVLRGADSEP